MSLTVEIGHAWPGFALDVAFEAPTPGVTALFGPSGSGKSTILAVLSGLLRPNRVLVTLNGETLAGPTTWVPPERRRFGVVFQDARLFPHLTVAANLRYGERRAPPGDIHFDAVIHLLGLAPLLARRPASLSGGERSRVAIGRALLAQPLLLLMDEPLAALDLERREEILPYLVRLKAQTRLPIVYVTHALDEVARLADSLVLIDQGQVTASGPLETVATRSDLALARRPDASSVLIGTVVGHDSARHLSEVGAAGTLFRVPLIAAPPGTSVRLRIPASDVVLATSDPVAISMQNVLQARVGTITHDQTRWATLIQIYLPDGAMLARVTPDAVARLALAPGRQVLALLKSVAIEVLLP